jgi:hypothetical protein
MRGLGQRRRKTLVGRVAQGPEAVMAHTPSHTPSRLLGAGVFKSS